MSGMKQVLVVDDDASMTGLLRDFLGRQGYCVFTTSSLESTLRWLDAESCQRRADIVVSDVQLGKGTGLDLVRRLRTERPALPVILFSVLNDLEREALESGARHFLRKPFPLATLANLLKKELEE